MIHTLLAIAGTIAAPWVAPATELRQVAPDRGAKAWVAPAVPSEKTRAIVLLHGLYLHPVRPAKATQPFFRDWQQPNSVLVKTLAKDFDVFAFGYAQIASVDDTARTPGLRDAVAKIRKAGYTEIVLVGHSAGGVISRLFVEENPDAGVTKVIAVASPFTGVKMATLELGYRKVQAPFVESLTPEARTIATKANNLALGKDVEFACVVCKLKRLETDGLVSTRSQWSEDLQQLGVPAVLAQVSHTDAMDTAATAKTILELANGKITRWSAEEVDAARKVLFREPGLLRR